MTQIIETIPEKKLWVIVSSLKDDTKEIDLQMVSTPVIGLIDEWQSAGKFIWSGPFDDRKTSMAVFEATEKEANRFFDKYDKICSGILTYHMYQWDSLPLLSILENSN